MGGYLTTAGLVIPVAGDLASVLAGRDPDQTYWLEDAIQIASTTQAWAYDRGKRKLGAIHKGPSPMMLNRSLWAIIRQHPRRLAAYHAWPQMLSKRASPASSVPPGRPGGCGQRAAAAMTR